MPGVKPVSSGERGQLSWLGPRIVLINAAAVSYQECLQGEAQWAGGGAQDALTERSVLVCKFGGRGGQGMGDCWSLGAYGRPNRGKELSSTQHMPSLSHAGHLPHMAAQKKHLKWFLYLQFRRSSKCTEYSTITVHLRYCELLLIFLTQTNIWIILIPYLLFKIHVLNIQDSQEIWNETHLNTYFQHRRQTTMFCSCCLLSGYYHSLCGCCDLSQGWYFSGWSEDAWFSDLAALGEI